MYDPAQTLDELQAAYAAIETADPAGLMKAKRVIEKAIAVIGGEAALDKLRHEQAERADKW